MTRIWYRIRYDVFETIVSPAKASSLEDALRFAMSPLCEWYLSSNSVKDPAFDMMSLQATTLCHKEYLEWCEARWPLST